MLSTILTVLHPHKNNMPQSTLHKPEQWLEVYGDKLYRYALLRVRSKETAEDLVQETLLAGLKAYKNFNNKSSVSTWLTGILKHKIIDFYRKNRHETVSFNNTEQDDEDLLNYLFDKKGHWQIDMNEWETPERNLTDQQFWQVFIQCLERLPQQTIDLLMLKTMSDVSSEDCCDVLGFNSTNQLWVTQSRARMKLRQCLDIKWFDHQ